MNLYLFNANDSAATYGIGSYLKELTKALEGAGINTRIVHLHSVRPDFEIVKTGQVENWYIPEVRNQNTFSGSIQMLEDYYRNVIYLLRLHIKETKDLVFHFNYNQSQFLAKELKKIFDCKTVATVHFMKWALALHGNLSRLHTLKSQPENQRNSFEQILYITDEYENLLYKEVDRVIALSGYMKRFLCSEYRLDPNKIAVIPNGLDDTDSEIETGRDVLRQRWHISANEFLILFAGRLNPVKGLEFLIKAFRKVLEIIPECRLIVAGNGNYDVYFQESKDICTKITFTGLLTKKELQELYQIADVGVAPSLYETFGYVAVEMMMQGLPIVTTASSGLNEVVDDTCGLKVPVIEHPDKVETDTDLLAEKILYLLQHPLEAKQMGQNGRTRYLQNYSQEIFRKNMLDFYNSLVMFNSALMLSMPGKRANCAKKI